MTNAVPRYKPRGGTSQGLGERTGWMNRGNSAQPLVAELEDCEIKEREGSTQEACVLAEPGR